MDRSEQAQFKRCMDFFCADPDFRHRMETDPEGAAASIHLTGIDAQAAARAIRWIVFRSGDAADAAQNPYVLASQEREKRIIQYLSQVSKPTGSASDRILAYEGIVRSRCRTESRLIRTNNHIQYYPYAIELSKGCSVQCPFCGFAAEKHTEDFRYTEENAALFRGILRILSAYAGPIAACCPLYFATEPFDNPDYEQFMREVYRIRGGFPQTTTAVADRIPDRIRAWMAEAGERGMAEQAALRISIRTLSQFRRIMQTYAPEELLDVELLANHPESIHACSASGRAMKGGAGPRPAMPYSICCISGMKINLVDRTVQWIEPEIPDEHYPLGYSVLETRGFSDADAFARILEEMDRRYAYICMPRSLPLRLNAHTAFREDAEALMFLGDGCGYRIGKNRFTRAVTEGIKAGGSFQDCIAPFGLSEEDAERLYDAFNALYIRGYIRNNIRKDEMSNGMDATGIGETVSGSEPQGGRGSGVPGSVPDGRQSRH